MTCAKVVPMTTTDRGPLLSYEVTWRSGHVETIMAHQVLWPSPLDNPFTPPGRDAAPRVMFHGEVDGQWQLLLVADESDILSIRRVLTMEEAK